MWLREETLNQKDGVQILSPDTGWTFFHISLLYELKCLFEKDENKRVSQFFKMCHFYATNKFVYDVSSSIAQLTNSHSRYQGKIYFIQ